MPMIRQFAEHNVSTLSSMKNVSILIPEGDISLVNVEGLHHIFSETNKALKREGKDPLFYFQLIGKKRSIFLKDFFSIHPNFLIEENVKTDILIIPALHGDIQKAVEINRDLIPWIVEQRNKGAEIISLCTGAFLLAATGLLNGKSCATHWIHASEFREMFPEVNLVGDQIMTDENGIYSSGAAYSYLNLILYVLEKYVRHEIVVFIAKIFAIDMGRSNQSQFMIFQGYKKHGDEYILKAQEYIERSYQQKIRYSNWRNMFSWGEEILKEGSKLLLHILLQNTFNVLKWRQRRNNWKEGRKLSTRLSMMWLHGCKKFPGSIQKNCRHVAH